MNDDSQNDTVAHIDNPTTEQEIGLLAGLVDGHFVSVKYRGFIVARNDNGDLEVSLNGRVLGGRYHLTPTNFNGMLEWLEEKDAYYGGRSA